AQALIVGRSAGVGDGMIIHITVPVPGFGSHSLDARQSAAHEQNAQDQNYRPPLHRPRLPPAQRCDILHCRYDETHAARRIKSIRLRHLYPIRENLWGFSKFTLEALKWHKNICLSE